MGSGIFRAINETRGTVLCARLEDAGGIVGQGRGLLGRKRLEQDEGMLFVRGRFEPFMWMHMFFMRFPIDIVFLDRNDIVVKLNRELRPWRVSSGVFAARKALELSAGGSPACRTTGGENIKLQTMSRCSSSRGRQVSLPTRRRRFPTRSKVSSNHVCF